MVALVSPGLSISVIDESAYLPTAVGTIPFVLFASAENKIINNTIAPGTLKSNAGKIYGISSQRELVSTFGVPEFLRTSANTPIHGNERNEYGLMAAYSALGLASRVWAIRADIDLDQLVGTTVRPRGEVPDGTNWLDLADTAWGIWEYNSTADTYSAATPLRITSQNDAEQDEATLIWIPKSSIGTIGSYCVVVFDTNNNIFYKDKNNMWVQVGSFLWQRQIVTVAGSATTCDFTEGADFYLNQLLIDLGGATSIGDVVELINDSIVAAPGFTGVYAEQVNGQLAFFVDRTSASDPGNIDPLTSNPLMDGAIAILDGNNGPMEALGFGDGTYYCPDLYYGSYTQMPSWSTFDTVPRPSKSVWIKTSANGSGTNVVFKQYHSSLGKWVKLATPVYSDGYTALYSLDRSGGGRNIVAGSLFVKYNSVDLFDTDPTASYTIYQLSTGGAMSVTGTSSGMEFIQGKTFNVIVSQPGAETPTKYELTNGGVDAVAFVSTILAANIPNVTAKVEVSGSITFTHTTGGIISLQNTSIDEDTITLAGFDVESNPNTCINFVPGLTPLDVTLTNWKPAAYTFSSTEPYTAPNDGTIWYYSDPAAIDILISDGTGWRGYKNVARDARGFNLQQTDAGGVIVSASKPIAQTDNNSLTAGDLWLDSGDLEHYPMLYRYSTTGTWVLVDKTDQLSQNGIIFADVRWDADGVADPIGAAYPSVADLQYSDYLDLDAPDYRLYPRGMLLFNTRRSGYNVKRYVTDYFNIHAYPNQSLPFITDAWVTTSGLKSDGSPYAGHHAQRALVVDALKAAVASNLDIREEGYNFNLLLCPGYPELATDLVSLNNDRSNTGFIIADTPMNLPSTITDITAFNREQVTRDAYMALYYPSALTTDLGGHEICVPSSHIALRTYIRSDNQSYQWFAPAGTRRGLVDNATAIGYVDSISGEFQKTGIGQSIRDGLYELNINPITLLQGSGIVVYGQKTRNPTTTSLDRVNVARLVNYLRVILQPLANQFLFEPNDKITRDQIKAVVSSALNDLVAKRGVYDYLVVCDSSNNTPDRIARNELYVDIAIEPMKAVEFIYIPIRLKNPGTIAGGGA